MTPKRCPYGACSDCIAHFTRDDESFNQDGSLTGRVEKCDFCRAFGHIPVYWEKLAYELGEVE